MDGADDSDSENGAAVDEGTHTQATGTKSKGEQRRRKRLAAKRRRKQKGQKWQEREKTKKRQVLRFNTEVQEGQLAAPANPANPVEQTETAQQGEDSGAAATEGKMKIVHLNVNGWSKSGGKLREKILLSQNPDVICLSETHLKKDNTVDIEGYKSFCQNRQGSTRGSGGVAILVKEELTETHRIKFQQFDVEGVLRAEITDKISDYTVVVYQIYLPPQGTKYGREGHRVFHLLLEEVFGQVCQEADAVYMCGDINARLGKEQEASLIDDVPDRQILDTTSMSGHGRSLMDFLNDAKFCVVNGRIGRDNYTCMSKKGQSVVDYFFVSHENLKTINNFDVLPCQSIAVQENLHELIQDGAVVPDHSLLALEVKVSTFAAEGLTKKTCLKAHKQVKKKKVVRVFPEDFMENCRFKLLLNELIGEQIDSKNKQESINEHMENVLRAINTEINQTVKLGGGRNSRRKFTPNKEYWTPELTKLWQKAHAAEQQLRKEKGPAQKKSYTRKLNLAFKQFDRMLRKEKRKQQDRLSEDLDRFTEQDPNSFWKHIKNLGSNVGERDKLPLPWKVRNPDGSVTTDHTEILTRWSNEFEGIYNDIPQEFDNDYWEMMKKEKIRKEREDQNRGEDELTETQESAEWLNEQITEEEVNKALRNVKNGKAVGLDGLSYELWKNKAIKPLILSLFQKCFENQVIPERWLNSIISPIPKKTTDLLNPYTYRGLAMQECIFKLYCMIIVGRLSEFLESTGTLSECQAGFRPRRSTTENVFTLMSSIRLAWAKKKEVFACFVDFKKAFDYTDRDLMFNTLLDAGVHGTFYNVLKSLYTLTLNTVRVNGEFSPFFPSFHGVQQGSPCSPTLYGMVINSLLLELEASGLGIDVDGEKLPCLAYADDLVIMAHTPEEMQQMLDILNRWCRKNRVIVNPDKSQIVHFRQKAKKGRGKGSPQFDYHVGDKQLKQVTSYCYLGVWMNEFLDMKEHLKVVVSAAGRALGSIIGKCQKGLRNPGLKSFTRLFEVCIRPILTYCAGAWSDETDSEACEQVMTRAQRYFLGVPKTTPTAGVKCEFGWLSIKSSWNIEGARLVNRILGMKPERWAKKAFHALRAISNTDRQVDLISWREYDRRRHSSGDRPEQTYEEYLEENFKEGEEKDTWCKRVQSIYRTAKVPVNWETESYVDEAVLVKELKEEEVNYNKERCKTFDKLIPYVTLKEKEEHFCPQPYLKTQMPKYMRSKLAQLRLCVLPLRIETDRFVKKKIPRCERVCWICLPERHVEDEIHFLFECKGYRAERESLFLRMNNPHCSEPDRDAPLIPLDLERQSPSEKLYWCMLRPFVIGKFICNIFNKREKMILPIKKAIDRERMSQGGQARTKRTKKSKQIKTKRTVNRKVTERSHTVSPAS